MFNFCTNVFTFLCIQLETINRGMDEVKEHLEITPSKEIGNDDNDEYQTSGKNLKHVFSLGRISFPRSAKTKHLVCKP